MKTTKNHPAWSYFLAFFLLAAFVITSSMLLFLNYFARSAGVEYTRSNLFAAALVTFGNTVFLSLICTAVDILRRKVMVDRPVRAIVEAARRITGGDFSARISPKAAVGASQGFDEIIDCFNTMAAELSGVETLRTDFIASVSHELKTPMAVMQNYGTLLQSPELTEEQRVEYAKAVTEQSRRLAGLVTNILKLNRLENQQIYPQIRRYDLGEQLAQCLLQFEDTWEEKGIDIDTHLEEDVLVESDEELLALVWSNLFSNALKFTDAGGKVFVSLKTQGDRILVSVTDTGCGMTPQVSRHIFEKFYQGDTSHATQGNGLGLSLVRRVMDIVGGEIFVESQAGEGSTFTVKIKRAANGEVQKDS